MAISLHVAAQSIPLKSVFRIARGAKKSASVIVVVLKDGAHMGWAESVPYARYGESIDKGLTQINEIKTQLEQGASLTELISTLPNGAVKNVLDCAYWDLVAKQQSLSVEQIANLPKASPVTCAQTLSINTPENMAKAAKELGNPPLIKVKLDSDQIVEKMKAIHLAAPDSQFIVDANEGWTLEDLKSTCAALKKLNVALIEQPLPAGKDAALIDFDSPVPLCADESCHTSADLEYLRHRYQAINIKLDKTGGLSEAIKLAEQAKELGFEIMLGCMVGSSLAMAPLSLLTPLAKYVDLDGPLLIKNDRVHGFQFSQGQMFPLNPALWGSDSNFGYGEASALTH